MSLSRRLFWLLTLSLCWLVAAAISLTVGSSGLWSWWDPSSTNEMRSMMLALRMPRTLAALGVGALLAIAGCMQQVLLRNPQADPYILGTAGAAGVGALLGMLFQFPNGLIPWLAGLGAIISIFCVFALAGQDRSSAQTKVLLTGIALSSFCVAITSLLLSLAPDDRLRGMIFWLLGDISGAEGGKSLAVALILIMVVWPFSRDLNRLSSGVMQAHSLGINLQKLRYFLYVIVAMATAVAVITAGAVGFVGLIIPHALRMLIGHDHRYLIPASALAGGTLLVLADTLGRTIIAPQQIPVGVITALIGVPVFLWMLRKKWHQ